MSNDTHAQILNGAGIFTYRFTIQINHSGKYTIATLSVWYVFFRYVYHNSQDKSYIYITNNPPPKKDTYHDPGEEPESYREGGSDVFVVCVVFVAFH